MRSPPASPGDGAPSRRALTAPAQTPARADGGHAGGQGCARSDVRGQTGRDRTPRIAQRRCVSAHSNHWIHRMKPPRHASPPTRRSTVTKRSSRAILRSRSHPLRAPLARRETEPAAPAPTPSLQASGRTADSLPDAARGAGPERKRHTAPSPTRTARRTPTPARNRHSDQTARPSDCRSLTERLDSRGDDRHRDPRRARSLTRSPRRSG